MLATDGAICRQGRVCKGESGHSARIRGAEHFIDLEKTEKKAHYKHVENTHNGEEAKFNDALTRQSNEVKVITENKRPIASNSYPTNE